MSDVVNKSAFPKTVQSGIPQLPAKPPMGWKRTSLGFDLYEQNRSVLMKDDNSYRLVTVKRARGGVVEREVKRGADISVKTQFQVRSGDFLISKRQIVHGACGLVPSELDGSTVSNEYSVLRSRGNIDLVFLMYLSHSTYFQQTCFHSSVGVHIEKMIFKLEKWLSWEFDLPPLLEQRRIAEILSTWDQAIEITEKLIANSQVQKQALMQQLFPREGETVPRLRFPGFRGSGGWVGSTIGLLCESFSGGTPPTANGSYYGGNIPFIRSAEINSYTTELFLTCDGVKNSSAKPVQQGDILIALYGANSGDVAISKINGVINQAILCLRYSGNNMFLCSYLVARKNWIISTYLQGGQGNLSAEIIKSIILRYPVSAEQQKIANSLSTLDELIRTTRRKLQALNAQRKALMQQLLTGKRRVKLSSAQRVVA